MASVVCVRNVCCTYMFVFKYMFVFNTICHWKIKFFSLILQNFITYVVVVLLALCGAVSVERLNWKLIRAWIPVNVIFIGMLVSGMYRYVTN